MAITKDQIFAVADEIDAAGQNATLAAVRKALGGGSFTTISEGMTEWKARKAAKESPLREPAPSAVANRLAELGAEIWSSALELANGRLATERESLETARLQLEWALKDFEADRVDKATERLEFILKQEEYIAVSGVDTIEETKFRLGGAYLTDAEIGRAMDLLDDLSPRYHQQRAVLFANYFMQRGYLADAYSKFARATEKFPFGHSDAIAEQSSQYAKKLNSFVFDLSAVLMLSNDTNPFGKGAFKILQNEWMGPHLLTVMQKVSDPGAAPVR